MTYAHSGKMCGAELPTWSMYYEPRVARFTMFNSQENVWCDLFLDEGFGIVEPWHNWKDVYFKECKRIERRNTAVLSVRQQRAILNAIWYMRMHKNEVSESMQQDIRNIIDALYRLLAL